MTLVDVGILIVRLVVGLTFAAHGAQKVFGWWAGPGFTRWSAAMERQALRPAWFWAAVSAGAELVGGILVAIGLLTPLASAFLVAQSLFIVLRSHLPKGFWNRSGGVEFPLQMLAGSLLVVAAGAGAISLDATLSLAMSDELRLILLAIAVAGAVLAMVMARPQPAPQPGAPSPQSASPGPSATDRGR